MGIILHVASFGQSGNNRFTRSYDTLITGIGYGTYQIDFPAWNPDSGLLVSATVRALVSVKYGFSIRNVDAVPGTYSIFVGHEDVISSTALAVPYYKNLEQKIGVYPLNPGESVSQAPFSFLENYANTDSVTGSVAAFMGTGKIRFTYSPATYTNIRTNNNASYNFSSTVRDTVHFSLSYLYSKVGGVLGINLRQFTATLQGSPGAGPETSIPSMIQLTWDVENEQEGRKYDVQMSRDGQHYTPVYSLVSVSPGKQVGYTYQYNGAGEEPGKIYFRLKMTDVDGVASYSAIKSVTLVAVGDRISGSNASGMNLSLYPNPAVEYINLSFGPGPGQGAGKDWQVDVLSSNGSLLQSGVYPVVGSGQGGAAGLIRVDFQRRLPAGAYFIRATDRAKRQTYSASFLVGNKS